MLDRFDRRINYLRISVTDRCNLRCKYCMPAEGVKLIPHSEILSYEEISEVVKVVAAMGIDKIRLTGGEPLVRRDIVQLVKMISKIEGVKDLGLTTNGQLLEQMAQELFDAGLKRINISLDTIDPQKYNDITRGGDISNVFKGIDAARKAGFNPIKINCVVTSRSDEPEAQKVKEYCKEQGLQSRFIHQMNLKTGEFSIVEGGSGGDCKSCNRLRLTSDGKIKPCLFTNLEYDIRKLGIKKAIETALDNKPERGSINLNNCFNNIGG